MVRERKTPIGRCLFGFLLCLGLSTGDQFHPQVFHGIDDEAYDFVGYFVDFQTLCYPSLRSHIIDLATFIRLFFASLRMY